MFQNLPGVSDLLPEASKFQHHIKQKNITETEMCGSEKEDIVASVVPLRAKSCDRCHVGGSVTTCILYLLTLKLIQI
jgi:predicted PP-loop superfamily ATPase